MRTHIISIIYFCTALIFGAFALSEQSEMLDIIVHDVYLVLPESLAWLIVAILFVFFAGLSLVFELTKNPMYKFLFGVHYLLTILCIWFIYYVTQQEIAPTLPEDMSVSEELQAAQENSVDLIQWVIYAAYTLIGAQAIFVFNILIALFRRRAK